MDRSHQVSSCYCLGLGRDVFWVVYSFLTMEDHLRCQCTCRQLRVWGSDKGSWTTFAPELIREYATDRMTSLMMSTDGQHRRVMDFTTTTIHQVISIPRNPNLLLLKLPRMMISMATLAKWCPNLEHVAFDGSCIVGGRVLDGAPCWLEYTWKEPFRNLTSVTMVGCRTPSRYLGGRPVYTAVDLTWVSMCPRLQQLSLVNCGLIDIGPLSAAVSVVSLNLEGNGVRDLSPLAGLGSLRMIDITGNTEISDLYPLVHHKELNVIGVIMDP